MDQEWKHKSTILEILPNTKRTQERRQKQLEEELQRLKERESLQKAQQEQQMQIQQLLKEKEQQKKLEDDRRREEERRNQEELQQINTLKGEFGNMINDLKTDNSKLDYTISGLDLRPAQIRILVKVAETNNTLKGLSMSRKRIQDEEGMEIVKSMEKNTVLERLELEGNNLGPKTASQIAKLLEQNRSIRVIDLENNNLTNQDKDTYQVNNQGVLDLFHALRKNDTLLQLNLCNCHLDKESGRVLVETLEPRFTKDKDGREVELPPYNTTLISVDLGENPNMDLRDVRKIQDFLQRNKKAYDDERYREFMERKRIGREEQNCTIKQIKREAQEVANEGIEDRMDARRKELEQQWKEELEKEQKLRDKMIHNLQKQAKLLGKKKKGGGGKKGK